MYKRQDTISWSGEDEGVGHEQGPIWEPLADFAISSLQLSAEELTALAASGKQHSFMCETTPAKYTQTFTIAIYSPGKSSNRGSNKLTRVSMNTGFTVTVMFRWNYTFNRIPFSCGSWFHHGKHSILQRPHHRVYHQ